MAAEALILENATTVPAGSVSNGLSVCGYETELNRLPNISFENQVYAEGFCPDAALAVGTLYPELVKCELLTRISEIQFVCVELNLYIDTHPDDADALSDYYHYSTMLKSLIESYEQQYGPLLGFGHSATQTGSWVCSEWPFE